MWRGRLKVGLGVHIPIMGVRFSPAQPAVITFSANHLLSGTLERQRYLGTYSNLSSGKQGRFSNVPSFMGPYANGKLPPLHGGIEGSTPSGSTTQIWCKEFEFGGKYNHFKKFKKAAPAYIWQEEV